MVVNGSKMEITPFQSRLKILTISCSLVTESSLTTWLAFTERKGIFRGQPFNVIRIYVTTYRSNTSSRSINAKRLLIENRSCGYSSISLQRCLSSLSLVMKLIPSYQAAPRSWSVGNLAHVT